MPRLPVQKLADRRKAAGMGCCQTSNFRGLKQELSERSEMNAQKHAVGAIATKRRDNKSHSFLHRNDSVDNCQPRSDGKNRFTRKTPRKAIDQRASLVGSTAINVLNTHSPT